MLYNFNSEEPSTICIGQWGLFTAVWDVDLGPTHDNIFTDQGPTKARPRPDQAKIIRKCLQTVSSRPDELFQISGLNHLYQVSHTSSVVGLIRQFPMFCPLSACMAGSLTRLQPQFGASTPMPGHDGGAKPRQEFAGGAAQAETRSACAPRYYAMICMKIKSTF